MAHLAMRVFSDNRLEPLLQKELNTWDEARKRKQFELEPCEMKLAEARRRLANLLDAIEAGTASARDPDIAGLRPTALRKRQ